MTYCLSPWERVEERRLAGRAKSPSSRPFTQREKGDDQ
jgi:hypothetical protein